MAEAFARIHGEGLVEARSAGSRPSGEINPRAVAAMRQRGYDLATHESKSLASLGGGAWDYVITMGCGDACPAVAAAHREEWSLPDPREIAPAEFNRLRDEIERRVIDLLARLRDEGGKG
jgi:protein-tyrosine-phosphatase